MSGTYTTLQCSVPIGDLPLQILWTHSSKSNQTDTNHSGMRTMKLGPRTSVLIFESISVNQIGGYTCSASSPAGVSNFTAELKEVMGRKELWLSYTALAYCLNLSFYPYDLESAQEHILVSRALTAQLVVHQSTIQARSGFESRPLRRLCVWFSHWGFPHM